MTSAGDDYVDCSFIMGSVAEVERVWSMVKFILSDHRKRMALELFESLLFLRYNERFWYPSLIAMAVGSVRDEFCYSVVSAPSTCYKGFKSLSGYK